MKKIGSVIALLLIVIAGIWMYLANEFEKIANEDLLPKIQNNDSLIKVDLDAVAIEKFKFRITFKDVTILPNVPDLRVNVDKIITSYNPFTDKITLCINSDKLSMGTENTAIYIPSPNQTVTFNRSILTNDFKDMDLSIISKNFAAYFASDDKFISRADKFKLTFSNLLNDGNYLINLKIISDKVEINPDSKYTTYLWNNSMPESLINTTGLDNNLYNDSYHYKIIESTGPIDLTTEYSLKLSENALRNIISALRGTKELSEVYKDFEFEKEDYSLSIKESLNNDAIKDNGFVHFSGNGSNINANVNISFIRNYNEIQKQEIISITSDFISKLTQQRASNEKLNLNQNFKGTPEDFIPLAEHITDIKNLNMIFNLDYDIASADLTHALNIGLNSFNVELNGTIKDKIYNAYAAINTPSLLINSLTGFYETSIKPLLVQNTTIENAAYIKSFHKIVENIKDNGFEALSTLHSGEELQEDDILTTNLVFNPQGFDFKINDKGFFNILTDERVVKFLQDMPEKDNQED
jgi:hypothetical protein